MRSNYSTFNSNTNKRSTAFPFLHQDKLLFSSPLDSVHQLATAQLQPEVVRSNVALAGSLSRQQDDKCSGVVVVVVVVVFSFVLGGGGSCRH